MGLEFGVGIADCGIWVLAAFSGCLGWGRSKDCQAIGLSFGAGAGDPTCVTKVGTFGAGGGLGALEIACGSWRGAPKVGDFCKSWCIKCVQKYGGWAWFWGAGDLLDRGYWELCGVGSAVGAAPIFAEWWGECQRYYWPGEEVGG